MTKENKGLVIVDAHAHPPRKGVPGVDDRPYVAPKTDAEKDLLVRENMDEFLSQMDVNQIDKRALIAMPEDIEAMFHFNERNPETGVTTYSCHEWIMQAVKYKPDRFFGLACINPLEEEAPKKIEWLVKEGGFKGVKIHQAHYQFVINDKRVYPFYEKCAELQVPVAFHTGYSPLRTVDRFIPTMPHLLDELAYDLPELKIIMCHAGGNWYQDGAYIALRNPNIMVDISGLKWLAQFFVYPTIDATKLIKRIVQVVGPKRVMYGTDNDDTCNVEFMKTCGLNDHDFQLVMGENAIRYFNL